MSKKYLIVSFAIVLFVTVIFFVSTAILFSQSMKRIEYSAEIRMKAAAQYTKDYIDLLYVLSTQSLDDEQINTWLKSFVQSIGFERIVIVDSSIHVQWSSNSIIEQNEDFNTYIIDSVSFYMAHSSQIIKLSPTIKIGNTYFKSLYYPFRFMGERYHIIIDADQNYFNDMKRLKTRILRIMTFLSAVSCCMIALLLFIDKKAIEACQKSAHNERLAFLGRASAELAHELKNPLAILKSSIDVLRLKYDPDKKETVFNFLSEEIMHLSELLQSILCFSREKILLNEPFSPLMAISEFCHGFEALYPHVRIKIQLSNSNKIIGDIHAFRIIVSNIVRNSITAMNAQGEITVSEQVIHGIPALTFTDTGPGIPPQLLKTLFEPFVTTSSTGCGLGLSIVKSLCDALNWEIICAKNVPGETVFALCIKEKLWVRSS